MTEVKWKLFRGRLRNALGDFDDDSAAFDDDAPTPLDIERLTNDAVKASVLTAFLGNKRGDLPVRYLPLLCGIEALGLGRGDYAEVNPATPKAAALSAKHRAHIERLKEERKISPPKATPSKTVYVSLQCKDPQAMKDAFRDRVKRSNVTLVDIGRRFHLSVTGRSQMIDLTNFVHPSLLNRNKNGPVFGLKIQEQFWDICAFLNENIHRHEPSAPIRSTEEFVVDLLTEGTVWNAERQSGLLKQLGDFVNRPSPTNHQTER